MNTLVISAFMTTFLMNGSPTLSYQEMIQEAAKHEEQKEVITVTTSLPAEPETIEKEEQVYTHLSDNEKDLLARLVHAEAKGEPMSGKIAVAVVVLNRIDSNKFPDTLKAVIYQKNQFSPVSNGSINKPADKDSIKAVEAALKVDRSGDQTLFFYNPKIATSRWLDSRTTVKVIGNHTFKE